MTPVAPVAGEGCAAPAQDGARNTGNSLLREAERKWHERYDEAMQWRDWQECDLLLDEREQAEWWLNRERDDD